MPLLLIHHAARGEHELPPNSLSALGACLAAGARVVEVDITPLADGDFALLHDENLAAGTDGVGLVASTQASDLRRLHLRVRGEVTGERAGTLSEALETIAVSPRLQELQLDLKPHRSVTGDALVHLARLVAPHTDRVRISSPNGRALRMLAQLLPNLSLGFDPLLYIDVEPSPLPAGSPLASRLLCHTGVYGYLDEHPLAEDRWGSPVEYLTARAEILWQQAPAPMWYVRAALLARMLDDGFNWIAYLHRKGAQVAAWTLDPHQPHHLALAQRLAAIGVDRITTNNATGLAAALSLRHPIS